MSATNEMYFVDLDQVCIRCDSERVDHTDPTVRPIHFICRTCNAKWKDNESRNLAEKISEGKV